VTEPAITDLGVIQPEPGFHEALRQATRETGTLLVLDETHTLICGCGGLVGEWALQPDIVTLGKSIAGGIPIGTYGMTSELAEVLDRPATRSEAEPGTVDQIATGGTFFANAVSLAASRAALEHLLTKKAYERARALGAQLAEGIEDVFRAAGLPWSVQRLLTRSGYTFADSLPTNAVEARAALDPELGALIRIYLANRGIWEAGWWAGPAVSIAAVQADIGQYLQTLSELTAELTGSA
jgi:glutamate-1-semialdehyde 2,1-aminomutase